MPKPKKAKVIKPDIKALNKAFEYFLSKDIEAEKNRPTVTNRERLIFLFKTLMDHGWRNVEGVLIVPFDKIMVEPYFHYSDMESIYLLIPSLFRWVQTDKDFYRKHNMSNYEPTFAFDSKMEYSNLDDLIFKDFTDDFLKEYLEDRLGVKYSSKKINNGIKIETIEVLENKTEQKKITIFINSDYNKPIEFNRFNKRDVSWPLFYNLARDQEVPYKKSFFDYLNSNPKNPLHIKHGFSVSKILKKDYGYIKPNIPINIVTQKFVSQRSSKKLKSA